MCKGQQTAHETAPVTKVLDKEATARRRSIATVAWWAELLTLLLTVLYCCIYARDALFDGTPRLSSPMWLRLGFCVSWAEEPLNSHTLSCVGDLICGMALVVENVRRHRKWPHSDLRVAIAVSAFTVLHGLGHLAIGSALGAEFMGRVRITVEPWWRTAVHLAIAWNFFSIGPFLGYCNGVPMRLCLIVHLLGCLAFLEFVPTQFVFGFVNLYLNVWYCTPRLCWLGTVTPKEVSERVDNSWALVSCGFLVLMLVAYAEMLTCDNFFVRWGGHALYDGSIVVISAVYSASLWYADGLRGKSP